MARRNYLSTDERLRFDSPPQLTLSQRLILVDWPPWAETFRQTIRTPTNQVGFALQLGYFRVMTRFYTGDRFPQADVEWVAQQLGLSMDKVQMIEYAQSQTLYRHRQVILDRLGYEAFGDPHQSALLSEAGRLTHLQTKPAQMLDALTTFLRDKRVEVPPYHTLRDVLTQALDQFQDHLQDLIEQHLQPADQERLDALIDKTAADSADDEVMGRYRLTGLKHISQSMRPKIIGERVAQFNQLKALFGPLAPLITRLELADDTIRYYAQYVLDNRSARLAERVHERYLRLLAFVTHQYLTVGDALILTLHKAVAAALNVCEEALKEQYYQSRYVTAGLVGQVSRRSDAHIDALVEIERIVEQPEVDDREKIGQIKTLLAKKNVRADQLKIDRERLQNLKTVNQPLAERADYYLALEKASLRLQARVSGIVQTLVYDEQTSHFHLMNALRYYQERGGEITASSALPLDFLDMTERQHVFTESGKLRVSLYKVLLFRAVRDGLRDGTLTVLSSYDYRSVEEYQIPPGQWQVHRETYLRRANLWHHREPAPTLIQLNERLNAQFKRTNEGLTTNTQVYFDTGGGWHLHRYRAEEVPNDGLVRLLYPTGRVISLRDVLTQMNELTGFLDKFQHKGFSQKPTRPDERLLLAAVIGYGENIGIRKMALISKNIPAHALETVATQYFSLEMTLEANDCILLHSNALPLTDLFRRTEGFIHTGSDGQKYDISEPSLRASASFKYFGNGEGMGVYSHLDEAGQLIYSIVFNSADRESPYVLDAILYNEVITPNAHATDMHGFSEPNFALTGLIGIDFRPRFVTIHTQRLYSIDAVSTYKEQGYQIAPDARIDYDNLLLHWDDALRLLTTVKLGYCKASTLLKRLNSYARQNPLYRALKDLGRLYKTLYILRYVDEPQLRREVEGVLTKVEHANKFGSAVTLGNNQALGWGTQYEVDIANGCKRLIMNAINFYNLLYLSEKLRQRPTQPERDDLLATILRSSTHTWHHINLGGEYDFSDPSPSTSAFDLDALMNLALPSRLRRR